MNKFFANNLPWKIVSLFLATLLWVFVINTQNPILTREVKDLSVTIQGISKVEEKGFAVLNEEEIRNLDIKVVVRGTRLEMEEFMKSKDHLEVKIDLTPYATMLSSKDPDSSEKPIPISVSASVAGIKIEEVKPASIGVIIGKVATETITVKGRVSGGNNSQYMTLEPLLSPREVEVTGPKDLLEKLDRAIVDVNVDDFSEDTLSYTVPIKFYDKEGEEIVGLKSSPKQIQVTLPIGKKKIVPLETQFIGTLPEGYIKTNEIITPKEITIVGKGSVIDKIQSIKLEPISLNNLIQSETYDQKFILPKDVMAIDEVDGKAVVTIEIQKEQTNEYTIRTEDIILKKTDIPIGYTLEIVEGQVLLELSGSAEKLLSITGKNIEAAIELTKLGNIAEGVYSVPITFKIPEGLKVISAPATIQIRLEAIEGDSDESTEGTDTNVPPGEPEQETDNDGNQ